MNVLPPPTDNLYKFCAITGVLIILASVYFPFVLAEDLSSKVTSAEVSMDKAVIEKRYLEKDLDRHLKMLKSHKLMAGDEKHVLASVSVARDQELKVAEIGSAVRECRRSLRFLYSLCILGSFFMIVG